MRPVLTIHLEDFFKMRMISAAFLAGAILVVAGKTAAAQAGPATAAPAPAPAASPKDIGPAEPWSAKPVGKYDLTINIPEGAMPVEVTISESAGVLSAMFYKVGDNDGHLMAVTVKDTDLFLKGTTEHGALVIQIKHHGPKLTGTWQMGENGSGTLEGSAR